MQISASLTYNLANWVEIYDYHTTAHVMRHEPIRIGNAFCNQDLENTIWWR
jgi:hypothetical protein